MTATLDDATDTHLGAGARAGDRVDPVGLIDDLAGWETCKRFSAAAQRRAVFAVYLACTSEHADPHADTAARAAAVADAAVRDTTGRVGLAMGVSQHHARRVLHEAVTVCTLMPNTLTALETGTISEYGLRLVVDAAKYLSPEDKHLLDQAMARDHYPTPTPDHRLGQVATGLAHQLDPAAALRRVRAAAKARHSPSAPPWT